jgi:hypothetical protein
MNWSTRLCTVCGKDHMTSLTCGAGDLAAKIVELERENEGLRAESRRLNEWHAWLEKEFRAAIRTGHSKGALSRSLLAAFDKRPEHLIEMRTEDRKLAALKEAKKGEG